MPFQATYDMQAPKFYMQSFRQDLNPPQRMNSDNIKQAFIDVQLLNPERITLIETFDGVNRVSNETTTDSFDDMRLRGIIYKPTTGVLIDIVAHLGFGIFGTWTKVTVGVDDFYRSTLDITDILKAAVDHGWGDEEKVAIFVSGPQGIADASDFVALALDWIEERVADFEETPSYEVESEAVKWSRLEYEGALFQHGRVKIEKDSLDNMANYHFDFAGQAATPDLIF